MNADSNVTHSSRKKKQTNANTRKLENVADRVGPEEALRSSETQLKSYLDSAADAIYILDAETGRIRDCNASACHDLGYSREELLELSAADIESQHTAAEVAAVHIDLNLGKVRTLEGMHKRKDGTVFPVEIRLCSLAATQPKLVIASVRDITERKRSEMALRESEEIYRSLFENMLNGFAFCKMHFDDDRRPYDFTYLSTNKAFEVQTGLRNVVGKKVSEIIPGICEADPELFEIYGRVARTGKPERFERFVKALQMWFLISVYSPQPGYFCAVFDVVTERKQAEAALRKSEERFRAIYERAPIGVALMDSASGRFLEVNPMYCEIVGYSQPEMLTLDFMSITHPEDLQRDLYEMSRLGRGEIDYYKMEKRYLRKNGTTAWVQLHVVPLTWKDEILTEHLAIVSDINERKRAEQEKTKLEAQLLQAQKMESVGRLAGGVAHDFNNMLGVILGHAELALNQLDTSHPLYDDLTEIRKAADRSADLTRQLLAFARKQIVAPRVLDLNLTITSMLRMLQKLIGEDASLSWNPDESLWPVKIDPAQTDQILVNLCVNARDAITNVGKITLRTENCSLDNDFCSTNKGAVPGEYVRLTVSDDGCGMDKETLAKIFEPYFTTKSVGKGTGLGLATIYGIVKQNNGFINVHSELGHGSTFSIYLPRYVDKTEQATETEGVVQPPKRGHETILLVEDELSILKLTKRMLEQQGYTVLSASTPGDALRLAQEHGSEIHLLITDIVMPGMNGRDLADNLLFLCPHLKKLFVSGYTADIITQHGVLDDRVCFIQKPFTQRSLAVKIREVLD